MTEALRRPALLLLVWAWAVGPAGLPPAAADTDSGNITIIETDPTILQPGELFDLNNRSLTFTPRSGGGYTVSAGALNFDANIGTNLNLSDDASVSQSLAFTFPFFGVNRTSVFINSNGNLTFVSASSDTHFNAGGTVNSLGADVADVLVRIARSPARIAVLWQDWNPAAEGGVFANSLSDRLIVTWSGVPLFNTTTTATFQVVLFSSGVIRMNYQTVTTTPGGGYLVGIGTSSGRDEFRVTTIDFSQGGTSVSSSPNSEPLAQVFGSSSGPLVHISAVARRFFNTHTDVFDQFVMFANFTHAMGNAFAFELTTRQTVSGINLSLFNDSSFFGSSGQLQSFLNMNRLGVYSDDLACLQNPTCRIPGNNDSALTLMGQESGHQWLAFVKFDNAGTCSDLLLGRQSAHWSFFHDTDASVMEGNSWVDNSTGTFTTDEDTLRFSALDQYIMGLRTAASVPTFFFVNNPTNTGGRTSSSTPQTGVTVSGTRQNVTVNQIQTCQGARSPSSGFTAANATTTWKQAFILLILGGTTAPSADTTKIDTIRTAWQSFFNTATGGRGSVDTTLPSPAISVTPSSQDFGNVTVGSSADRNFTVQNTGGGTLTGTASTSAPFSVISGASYSLGAGASQTVTVRFSPTSAATLTSNVTFTGGGGVTRAVTGTGANNPVPTLSSLSPSSATAGGAAFTLTVTGSNFVASSVVRWGGSDRTTTFVSSTELRASIAASDIATAGTVEVRVFNPTPGGGTSGALTFTITNPTLMVTKSGTGSGTVTSSPAGINCGSDCSESYSSGTSVTLTAAAASDSDFTGWSGGGCSGTGTCIVTLTANTTVTATFTLKRFDLTVTLRGSASGTVTSSPTGINCGSDCTETYTINTSVTLTATPSGASFKEWGGACSGTTATCTLTMTAARSATANFSKVFTDATLTAGTTLIKAAHITDLREAINTLRAQNGLAAFAFTDSTLTSGSTLIKRVHVTELRTALAEAYQAAGRTQPTYTDPTITAGQTVIRASHLSELRAAVRALE